MKVDAMAKARSKLLLRFPWYGSLALRLKIKPVDDNSIPTAGVDGVTLFYNTKWFDTLSEDERLFVVAHEVLHCALLHFSRRQARDPFLWNLAGDAVINQRLTQDNVGVMPKGGFIDAKYADMYSEQVYNDIFKNAKKITLSLPDNWNFGGVMDKPQQSGNQDDKSSSTQMGQGVCGVKDLETEWKIAVEQATQVAEKAGNMPASLKRAIGEGRQSRVNWRNVLRKYLTTLGNYSWARPNKRYIHNGLYLPSMTKTKMSHIVIALDTSGSIDDDMLTQFAAETCAILKGTEQWPNRVSVIYCDAKVQGWHDCDEGVINFEPKGGGGTQYQPVFDFIKREGWEPQVLFFLGDLCHFDTITNPNDYDVCWIAPSQYIREMPFGEVVGME